MSEKNILSEKLCTLVDEACEGCHCLDMAKGSVDSALSVQKQNELEIKEYSCIGAGILNGEMMYGWRFDTKFGEVNVYVSTGCIEVNKTDRHILSTFWRAMAAPKGSAIREELLSGIVDELK